VIAFLFVFFARQFGVKKVIKLSTKIKNQMLKIIYSTNFKILGIIFDKGQASLASPSGSGRQQPTADGGAHKKS